ncbi:hypothetical protein ACFQ8S_19785 [Streptomyces virginiae]
MRHRRTLTLTDPGPQFYRLLRITGTDALFDLSYPGPPPGSPDGAR